MTSLSAIRLNLHPVYSLNSSFTGSSSTVHSQKIVHEEEEDHSGNNGPPCSQTRYDFNASDTTLHIPPPHGHASNSPCISPSPPSTSPHGAVHHHGSPPPLPQYPGQVRLSPSDSREMYLGHNIEVQQDPPPPSKSSSTRPPSVVRIDHALKPSFLSSLGPGIPVTRMASVFGNGLNGFVSKNPANPGRIFGYTPEEEKRLVRKIDWRIIPVLGMFYALSTINRVNMLNARIYAFESTLDITPEQYNWVVALSFVGYRIAEIPSNLALLYLTPKVWLPASMFIWGCITLSLAFAKNYHTIYVGRFLLGVSEAALIPEVLIYVSMFYKRSEQTFRMAILQAFSSAAGGLGGLISRGMDLLDGKMNLLGWQWIFMVESLGTIGLAMAGWCVLTKSPESASWLNQRETSIAVYRIRHETKIQVTQRISWHHIGAAIRDRNVYGFMAMHFFLSITLVTAAGLNSRAWGYMTTGFEALAVQEPTHDARQVAQLISTPTYIVGAISSFLVALLADRTQQRGIITMFLCSIMIVAYCMALLTLNVYVNYAAVMILSMAQTPLTPVVTSWLTTNLGGYAKRVIAVAMFLLSSSMGSVVASQVFKTRDRPRYTMGHLIIIACVTIVICLAMVQRYMLKRENNRRNCSVSFGVNPLKSFSKAELRDLNDKHPAFRYTL
ncbi:MAG: major facilitator superfamily domain-containing protein [Benniella sp.]|nr:MAG: major facilitator superfamily domain-containing protein [Benniella sp.]